MNIGLYSAVTIHTVSLPIQHDMVIIHFSMNVPWYWETAKLQAI